MTANFHTHTFRCKHATGTERQYLDRAIKHGVTHFGFSDHVPFRFPDGYETEHRVYMSQAQEYMDTLRTIREEYADKIKVFIGFEVEYLPMYFDDMMKIINDLGTEYIILGQHFIGNERPDYHHSTAPYDSEEMLVKYVDQVIEAMETGVFSYVAHPDIINFVGDDGIYDKHMRRLCQASVRLGIPFEINFLGIRGKRKYPKDLFWKIAGEEGVTVVFGFDAHDTRAAYDGESFEVALQMVEKFGLKYEPYPTLICPRTKKPLDMGYTTDAKA